MMSVIYNSNLLLSFTSEGGSQHKKQLKQTRGEHRDEMRYYKEILRVIGDAPYHESILDVGSAFPPFLRRVPNIPNKTIIAPYFVNYGQTGYSNWSQYSNYTLVQADFLKMDVDKMAHNSSFDIVMCSQVGR